MTYQSSAIYRVVSEKLVCKDKEADCQTSSVKVKNTSINNLYLIKTLKPYFHTFSVQ